MFSISSKCNHFLISQEAPSCLLTLNTCDNSLGKQMYLRKLCKVSDQGTDPLEISNWIVWLFSCCINVIDYCSYFSFFTHIIMCICKHFSATYVFFLRLSEIVIRVIQDRNCFLHKIYTNTPIKNSRWIIMNHLAIRGQIALYQSCLSLLFHWNKHWIIGDAFFQISWSIAQVSS